MLRMALMPFYPAHVLGKLAYLALSGQPGCRPRRVHEDAILRLKAQFLLSVIGPNPRKRDESDLAWLPP